MRARAQAKPQWDSKGNGRVEEVTKIHHVCDNFQIEKITNGDKNVINNECWVFCRENLITFLWFNDL